MPYVSTIDEHANDHERRMAKIDLQPLIKAFRERLTSVMDETANDLWIATEDSLKTDVELNLDGMAARRAEDLLQKVLDGDEDACRSLFECAPHYDGRGRVSVDLRDPGPIALRRKIVELHADLLRNEVVADLEAKITALVRENRRLHTRMSEIISEQHQ